MTFGDFRKAVEAVRSDGGIESDVLSENGKPTLKGKGYLFDDELIAAIDVALALGRPLLVSGEPGCGKTELGYAVARHLGIQRLHLAVVKSSAEAGDLFYTYDALRRFREAQLDQLRTAQAAGQPGDIGDFIDFQALGLAILDANERASIAHLLRGKHSGYRIDDPAPRRAVVVIDEIDKASRDFPNDLLHEIDNLSFRIREYPSDPPPETPSADKVDQRYRPLVVITSNEERQLPDAFLRRCVFHEIAFPDENRLREIVQKGLKNRLARLGWRPDGAIEPALSKERANALVRLLMDFRNSGPEKKPGVAEALDAAALLFLAGPSASLAVAQPALSKLRSDRVRLAGLFH